MSSSSAVLARFPVEPIFTSVLSEDNAYVIYLSQSNIIVRSTMSLATYKIISLPDHPSLDSMQIKLSPDNKLLAVFSPTLNSIKIIRLKDDVECTIVLSNIEEIVLFEWLDISMQHGNDHIIAVYSKNGLSLKLHSIEGSATNCVHTIYKYTSKVIKHPFLDQYTIALKSGIKNRLFTFTITENVVQQVSEFELKDNSSDIIFRHSPLNSWILVSDALSGGMSIGVYNFLGLGKLKIPKGIETGYAFQSLISPSPSLGVTSLDWALNSKNEEIILLGDHLENIYLINMKGQLKIDKVISHNTSQSNETGEIFVFEKSLKSSNYNKKLPTLFKLPSNDKLELHQRGINELKVATRSSHFIVVTKSMPSVLFLWDIDSLTSPILIINTQSTIVSTSLGSDKIPKSNNKYINSIIDSIVIVNNGIDITIYTPVVRDVPLLLDVGFSSKILGFNLDNIVTENGEVLIKITCWSKDELRVLTQSLSRTDPQSPSNYDDNASSLLRIRQGSSPMAVEETDTNVRELINGVQQAEWVKPSASFSDSGDTFISKKRKQITGKENEVLNVAKKLKATVGNVRIEN